MKKLIVICLLASYSLSSFAQEKTMLTKEETINYIQKKLKEIIDFEGRYPEMGKYTESGISFDDPKISIFRQVKYKNSSIVETTIDFNPVHITDITDGHTNDDGTIGYLKVKVVAKTGMVKTFKTESDPQPNNFNYWSKSTTNTQPTELLIAYLKSDGSNFTKIKKALEHRGICVKLKMIHSVINFYPP